MAPLYQVTLVLTPQSEGGYTVTSPAPPELVTEGDSLKVTEADYYQPYTKFSWALRGWLFAYGIGAPALFFTHEAFSKTLNKSIIFLFLFGICMQTVATVIYKYSMGYLYFGEVMKNFQETRRYKVASWIVGKMWLEMLLDVLTIVPFLWATFCVLMKFTS